MSHDLIAELQAYKNELANVENAGNDERAGAVRAEISRVEGLVRDRAEGLEKDADDHLAAGRDVPAAEARVEARRYRAALGESGSQEDAAESKPQEKAVPKRGGGRKSG